MRWAHLGMLLGLALSGLAGCEAARAVKTVHPATGPGRVETDLFAYQFTQGRKIEVVSFKEWAMPAGEAVPDYEYTYVVVPEPDGKHAVGDKGLEVYWLTRKEGQEKLYVAQGGTVEYRRGFLDKDHVHVTLDLTLAPVWPVEDANERRPLKMTLTAPEDVRVCQGLINKYGEDVKRLQKEARTATGENTAEAKKPAAKSGPSGAKILGGGSKKSKKKKEETPATPTSP